MKTKEIAFQKRQIARKANHEIKRKAHKKLINSLAIAEYNKFEVKGAEEAQKVGAFLTLFKKMWRDVLRGRTREKVAKKEEKAKERARIRKENAKKDI